ncbi:substrate-binding periplasmic protein [Neptuniibacter halophilus]|uniref:substrate-binding periplasmic protein n=1 Tax=Neptuniibacter halophilus TaxID=651666 RepID=UPI0025736239|nr:transporter substrate-binding domain-containing protein [Neptuniibacter halophilus]
MFRACCISLIVLLSLPVQAEDKNYRYAVTDESWVPYWIVSEAGVEGIFSDLMQALDRYLNLPVSVQALPGTLPPKRAQMLFRSGDLQLECCVNPLWRLPQDGGAEDLWSEAVLASEEVLIFARGQAFPYHQLTDLKGKRIATVLGYGYVGDHLFLRQDSTRSTAQLMMVADRRVDAGIIDRNELAYLFRNEPRARRLRHLIEIGPVVNRSALKLRINRDHPELLEPVNSALHQMKQDGTLQRLIRHYIETP